MSSVRYDQVAGDFDKVRDRQPDTQAVWCERIAGFLPTGMATVIVDVGSGTGIWTLALAASLGATVYGVEPAEGMRRHAAVSHAHESVRYLAGHAGALPLAGASADGAWLSTVIHQFPDLEEAAGELDRVLKPGAPVLIRSSFPGRQDEIELFQVFPSALRLAETWPRLGRVITAFEEVGFAFETRERVREPTFDSYDDVLELLPAMRRSDTALIDLREDEWRTGVARFEEARNRGDKPWELGLDLLVMRKMSAP